MIVPSPSCAAAVGTSCTADSPPVSRYTTMSRGGLMPLPERHDVRGGRIGVNTLNPAVAEVTLTPLAALPATGPPTITVRDEMLKRSREPESEWLG